MIERLNRCAGIAALLVSLLALVFAYLVFRFFARRDPVEQSAIRQLAAIEGSSA